MVNGSLNEYVITQLRRGYPPEAIRTSLIQAGYNPQDIDYALRIGDQTAKRHIEITGKRMAITLGGLLALCLLVFAGILIFSPEAKDISMAVRVEKPQVFPGGQLEISVTLTSEQSKDAQVSLDYAISDISTRKTVTTRSERLVVGESSFSTQSIPLPERLAPGEYEAKVFAKFEGITKMQTARFTVQQPAAVAPPEEELEPFEEVTTPPGELECPPSCDDLNPATEDSCVRGSCVHTQKEGVCGDGDCGAGENTVICPEDCGAAKDKEAVMRQALQQAAADPEKAATLCNSLVLPTDKDQCFAAIANASKRSALCTNIQDTRAKDNCLMEFALADDFTVCTQLTNRYLMTSCMSLQRLKGAQAGELPEAEEELPEEEVLEE